MWHQLGVYFFLPHCDFQRGWSLNMKPTDLASIARIDPGIHLPLPTPQYGCKCIHFFLYEF